MKLLSLAPIVLFTKYASCFPNLSQKRYSSLTEGTTPFLVLVNPEKAPDLTPYKQSINIFNLPKHKHSLLGLSKSPGSMIFYKPRNDIVYSSEFKGLAEKAYKWLEYLMYPVSYINSQEELLDILHTRTPNQVISSVVVAYIPAGSDDLLEDLDKVIEDISFKDTTGHFLSHGRIMFRFVVTRNKKLAERLGICYENELGETEKDLILYKYINPYSTFHRWENEDYRDSSGIQAWIKRNKDQNFQPDKHKMQMHLKLRREKLILKNEGTAKYDQIRAQFKPAICSNVECMAEALRKQDLIIYPFISYKATAYLNIHFLIKILRTKLSVVMLSVKNGDVASEVKRLGLDTIARSMESNLIFSAGHPSYLLHLHIKNFQLYHHNNVELRYLVFEDSDYPTVKNQYRMAVTPSTTMQEVNQWLASCLSNAEPIYYECK